MPTVNYLKSFFVTISISFVQEELNYFSLVCFVLGSSRPSCFPSSATGRF